MVGFFLLLLYLSPEYSPIVRSNQMKADNFICIFLSLKSLEKVQCVYFKNITLTVNLHIDHIFSGYVCVP